jgi:hypothetical protein
MQPVFCRVRHDPEAGTYGDCLRACVASILEIDAETVPHFFEDDCDGATGMDRLRKWLGTQGLAPFAASFDASASLDEILGFQADQNPGVHYLLFGRTEGGDHVVVAQGDKVVHNPEWYPSRLVAAGSHGYWTVMVLARR